MTLSDDSPTAINRAAPDRSAARAVRFRHWVGAVFAGVAAWLVVLLFSSANSVLHGYGVLGPYEGTGDVLGVRGTSGLLVGLLVDLLIPLVAAFVFVATLGVFSRRTLAWPSFTTRGWAVVDGALLGIVVWAVFYIPVIYSLDHPTFASFLQPLGFGLLDHVAFGVTIGWMIFEVGGPVDFRRAGSRP